MDNTSRKAAGNIPTGIKSYPDLHKLSKTDPEIGTVLWYNAFGVGSFTDLLITLICYQSYRRTEQINAWIAIASEPEKPLVRHLMERINYLESRLVEKQVREALDIV